MESVCLPGSSLYEIKHFLEIELLMKNYELIIVVGGRNGGFVDNVFTEMMIPVVVLRNDILQDKYLNKNDKAHPNQKGINLFTEKILKSIKNMNLNKIK